jgi:hypothetical protein
LAEGQELIVGLGVWAALREQASLPVCKVAANYNELRRKMPFRAPFIEAAPLRFDR